MLPNQMATGKQQGYLLDLRKGFQQAAEELDFGHEKWPNPTVILPSPIAGFMPKKEAHRIIDGFDAYIRKNWGAHCSKARFPMNRQTTAAELLYRAVRDRGGNSPRRYDYDQATRLARKIGFQGDFRALVYTRHTTAEEKVRGMGDSVALSVGDAEIAFRKTLSMVKSSVAERFSREQWNPDKDPKSPAPIPVGDWDEDDLDEPIAVGVDPADDKAPAVIIHQPDIEVVHEAIPKNAVELREWLWKLHCWVEEHPIQGFLIDAIGMRPFKDGAKMFVAGIPVNAIKQAVRMHWNEQARRETNDLRNFEPQGNGKSEWSDLLKEFDPQKFGEPIPGMHRAAAYAKTLVKAHIPVLFVGPSGCLAADTLINVNRAGKGSTMTIEHVVKMHNGGKRKAGKPWNPDIPTYVGRNDGGVMRLARLADAWESGVKTTYTLTTETGREIRATAIHPFQTPSGEFVQLQNLSVDDLVCVNKDFRKGVRRAPRNRNENYRYKYTRFHPNQLKVTDGYRVLAHRLVIEAEMNGMEFDDYVDALRNDEAACASFEYLSQALIVHHKDENQTNNDPDNLEIMTQAEHARLHEPTNNILDRIGYERITSIELYGEEMTYDIEVIDDPHCFLANGFVVHNTGKTFLGGQICEMIAQETGRPCPFGFVSMTRGTSPSAFNGRPLIADDGTQAQLIGLTLKYQNATEAEREDIMREVDKLVDRASKREGVIVSQFQKIYGGGGGFLFDELDGADENLLLLVNAALSNGAFANPATGTIIQQHPDFFPMAAANTLGQGGTQHHGARNRLDHATLDRWRAGRVVVTLDKELAFRVYDEIITVGNI